MATWLAVAATVWLPLSMLINPGWLLLSPLWCASVTPLLVPLVNRLLPGRVPVLESLLELAFFGCWVGIGVFLVDADDTPGGAHSIYTRAVGGDESGLVRRSDQLASLSGQLAVGFLLVLLVVAAVRRVRSEARTGAS
jgi:hypothetical protein